MNKYLESLRNNEHFNLLEPVIDYDSFRPVMVYLVYSQKYIESLVDMAINDKINKDLFFVEIDDLYAESCGGGGYHSGKEIYIRRNCYINDPIGGRDPIDMYIHVDNFGNIISIRYYYEINEDSDVWYTIENKLVKKEDGTIVLEYGSNKYFDFSDEIKTTTDYAKNVRHVAAVIEFL